MKLLPLCILLLLPVSGAASAQALRINEFLADNSATSLQDEDGETPDWIELHNPSASAANLAGLYLTDDAGDLTKWPFPEVSIPAGGYLLVFASEKHRTPVNGDPLHTNFRLARSGEYLALVAADGTTVLSEFGPAGSPYPAQRSGVSYGVFGSPLQSGFFFNPTPGTANDESNTVLGFVADTEFDVDRGIHSAPFSVTITTATPGAMIRYTTDGSWPSASEGTVYNGPVQINRTRPLKAIAYKEGFVPSNVDTQTYILVDSVVSQTPSNTVRTWRLPSSWNGTTPYYGMDNNPDVDPLAANVRDGLTAVPTLSIAMEADDLFGEAGIYSHPQSSGVAWERKTSLEFIDPAHPDGSNNFQHNCAIRIHGGAFRSFNLTKKKSFRVLFKPEYGSGSLPTGGPGKLEFPLFGPDATSEFQTLVFRMESNDGWQWVGAGAKAQYARDEFGRRAQLALGQPSAHGRFCHLYLNGVYWGLYNVTERPDSGFAESYLGANRDTWQGQNSGSPINSATSIADWNTMLTVVDDITAATTDEQRDVEYLQACGFTSSGSPSRRVSTWIDPDNFADYLLVNWYGGNSDWPFKNYYCGRSPDADSTGFKFFMWDAEWSLFLGTVVTGDRTGDFRGVAAPQQHLARSPEYRVRFGDRAHRALFNDGIFTAAKATALYTEITKDHLRRRILYPEAARWGHQHLGAHDPLDWQAESVKVTRDWLGVRAPILLNQLKARNLYPDLGAPTYSQHGGSVPSGGGPTLSVPDNVTRIYYQFGLEDEDPTDYEHSLDPRLVGGAINPAATLIDFGSPGNGLGTNISAPLALSGPGFLFSRSYDSTTGEWSALNTALFTIETVPADAANLVVSEIHYHPAAPDAEEIAAGHNDQELFEFLEVQNIGGRNIDLSGVDFIAGIDFTFPNGFTLPAGERAVVINNRAAFDFRYPGFPEERVAGVFLDGNNLRNSGDTLTIRAANGSIIKSFAYDDEAPWPTAPDGTTGVSLVLMHPAGNPDHTRPENWRPASATGGNPGTGDALVFTGDPHADEDRDGVAAYLEHAVGTSDQDGNNEPLLTFGRQTFEVDGVPDGYFALSHPRELRAEDVEIIPKASSDLQDWDAAAIDLVMVSEVPAGGTRSVVTWRTAMPAGNYPELYIRLLVRERSSP